MGSKIFNSSYLKQNGVDAEEVKEEYVSNGSHYDIYRQSKAKMAKM